MGEQTSHTNAWNIDLNLLPSPEQLSGVMANRTMNLIDLVDQPSDRITETNNGGVALDKTSKKRKNVEEGGGSEGSVFDCNICLDLAKNPVVTCCGHLFCWPCLYRWLHLRSSQTKACPVCKGEVTDKNAIPIYGGENNVEVRHEDSSSTLQIPSRPMARRVSNDSSTSQTIQWSVGHLGSIPAEFEASWSLDDDHVSYDSTNMTPTIHRNVGHHGSIPVEPEASWSIVEDYGMLAEFEPELEASWSLDDERVSNDSTNMTPTIHWSVEHHGSMPVEPEASWSTFEDYGMLVEFEQELVEFIFGNLGISF